MVILPVPWSSPCGFQEANKMGTSGHGVGVSRFDWLSAILAANSGDQDPMLSPDSCWEQWSFRVPLGLEPES